MGTKGPQMSPFFKVPRPKLNFEDFHILNIPKFREFWFCRNITILKNIIRKSKKGKNAAREENSAMRQCTAQRRPQSCLHHRANNERHMIDEIEDSNFPRKYKMLATRPMSPAAASHSLVVIHTLFIPSQSIKWCEFYCAIHKPLF